MSGFGGKRATEVPRFVEGHRKALLTDDWKALFFMSLVGLTKDRKVAGASAGRFRDELHEELGTAPHYFVSDAMAEMARALSNDFDDDEMFLEETFPSPAGFLLFQRPLITTTVFGGHHYTDALEWFFDASGDMVVVWLKFVHRLAGASFPGDFILTSLNAWNLGTPQARVGPRFFPRETDPKKGRIVADVYRDAGFSPEDIAEISDDGEKAAADEIAGSDDDERSENTNRILMAIFELMKETRLVTAVPTTVSTKDKKTGRRGTSEVVVVHLRRESDHGTRSATGTFIRTRFPVRGHWRRQPYGPGRKLVKRIYIASFWKGSPDDPADTRPRVISLDR